MLTKAAGVMVRVADPVVELADAVIVVTPVLTLLARPIVGAESLIVATLPDEDVQYTELVKSC